MLKHANRTITWLLYGAIAVFLFISIILAINIGAVDISPQIVFEILVNKFTGKEIFAKNWADSAEAIVWTLRFPKVIVAAAAGAGLALAGIMMQALTRNPMADPYILGISSGASTGAVMVLLIGSLPLVGKLPLALGAFLGAMLTSALVFIFGANGIKGSTTRLVLVGMAVSAMFSALTDLIIFLTPESKKVTSALFWMTGSFAGTKWTDVPLALAVLVIALITASVIHKEMDALLMGEDLAQNYGVNVSAIKWILIIVSTLLTAVMVSMSGAIGFVGLVMPHIARQIMGASHKKMMYLAMLVSSCFMIWTDVIARTCVAPEELPVGVITSLTGAPFFLSMLRKNHYDFGK